MPTYEVEFEFTRTVTLAIEADDADAIRSAFNDNDGFDPDVYGGNDVEDWSFDPITIVDPDGGGVDKLPDVVVREGKFVRAGG